MVLRYVVGFKPPPACNRRAAQAGRRAPPGSDLKQATRAHVDAPLLTSDRNPSMGSPTASPSPQRLRHRRSKGRKMVAARIGNQNLIAMCAADPSTITKGGSGFAAPMQSSVPITAPQLTFGDSITASIRGDGANWLRSRRRTRAIVIDHEGLPQYYLI